MPVIDAKEAVAKVIHVLKTYDYEHVLAEELNRHGHWKVTALNPVTNTSEIYYVKFDRDPFHAAAYELQRRGYTGIGDAFTINVEYARIAKAINATLLFVQPDKIYAINAQEFYRKGIDYPQKFSNEVVKCVPCEDCDEWALTIPKTIKELQEVKLTRKEQKAAEIWREYWNNIDEWKAKPMLKCPYCKFQNVYQGSIDHHQKYTHIRGHPSPPNVWAATMTEKDWLDWEDAMSGMKGRRSGLKVLL